MRDRPPSGWLARLVPEPQRRRVFEPALMDLRRERRIRLRRVHGMARRAVVGLCCAARAVRLALECRRLARAGRGVTLSELPVPVHARSLMSLHDLTFALRMLRKAPAFTAAAVVAIALGVGANTAMFTVIKEVLLQPLPYPEAARVMDVDEWRRGSPFAVSPPNFKEWVARNRSLSALGAYNEQALTLMAGSEPQRIDGAAIDGQVLRALEVSPALGRAFSDADLAVGARPVVLIGNGLWRRAFGGDRGVVGRTIQLEGEPCEVAGVMPEGFDFPGSSEMWTPLILTPKNLSDAQRGAHYLNAVGRLRDGVTAAQASADLDGIEQDIVRRFPTKVTGYSVHVQPLLDSMVGDVQRPLWILFGAVAFVLLIACVNVSNLLLARATTRTGEMAVRSALGAGRGRLLRQLLAESVVLAVLGGAAGVVLGSWAVRVLLTATNADLPRAAGVHLDGTVLLFTLAVSVVAGVLFGLFPAAIASRPDLAVFLRDVRRDGGSAGGRRRLREALVAAQVALALVLLVGAGLAARSFAKLTSVDPGFRTHGVLSFEIVLPDSSYATRPLVTAFFRRYLEAARQSPGIRSIGAVSFAPLTPAGFGGSFTIEGKPDGSNEGNAQIRAITPGYVETLAIPLRAGRVFDARDSETAQPVALVSEAAARAYWPGQNAVGQQLRLHVNEPSHALREIVGVVADVHLNSLDGTPGPVIYVPHTQYGPDAMTVVARTAAADPMQALPLLRTVLHDVGPGVAMDHARPMDALAAASVAQPRFRTVLLLIFAGVSLLLASVGLYGVVAFTVSQRTAELGLRMALGADRRGVLRLVLIDGMLPVAAGIAVGLAGAIALSRVMRTLLYQVDAFDPLTFAAVSATLALVALVACYVPARRATRLDPVSALR